MRARFCLESVESRRLFAAPVLDAIGNVTVPVGKTIQVPVTSSSGAGKVTYSVRDNSTNVRGGLRLNNTFIEMKVAGYGQPMVFELFNETAPETVRRITGLVNSGFYDGLTFHRIVNNFVIQGGDPAGDGSGGPQFSFEDEFKADTTFTGTGQLAMANSGKDTNGSQFFVTEGPQRLLDFNHTIFGQLVRGEATRQAISDLNVNSSTGAPTSDVVITSVNVVKNTTDGVLVVSAKAAGTYRVKVTATNADGSTSRSFTVTSAADTVNDPPILDTSKLQRVYYTTVGKPVTLNLSSTDPEGDTGFFTAQFVNQNDATGAFGGTNNNSITLTPTKAGATTITVGVVSSSSATSRGSTSLANGDTSGISISDSQTVTIAAGELPISASANAFDAASGAALNNVLVGAFRDSDATGSARDFTASIDWGDGTVTAGTVSRSRSGRYAVYGSKTYAVKASGALPITVTVTGDNGARAVATSTATVRPFAEVVGGVLIVNGTSQDDRIGIGRKSGRYTVTVNGRSTSYATGGVNSIQAYGLAGSDRIQVADTVFATTYLDGGVGNDAITGGSGNDVINAGDGADTVVTGAGTNRVGGGAGRDTLTGGSGRDRIYGGLDNDNLDGGGGRDIVDGEAGNDVVVGGAGNDSVYGGRGSDVLNGSSGTDLVDGGVGGDRARDDDLDTFVSIETLV